MFRTTQQLIGRFTQFEKWIWIGVLAVLLVTTLFRLLERIFPSLSLWTSEAGFARAVVYDIVGTMQAATLTLVVAMPLFRLLFTRNPAEKIAGQMARGRLPYLIKDLISLTRLGQIRFPVSEFELVSTTEKLKLFSRLNSECFQESANYSGGYAAKFSRNQSIQEIYPNCFAFVVDELGNRMGISMAIPLNLSATQLYRRGVLSDHNVMDIHVAKKGEACGCILLFAIGMRADYQPGGYRSQGSEAIRKLIRNHVYHIWRVASDFGLEEVSFIMQVERPSIRRLARKLGFRRLEHMGGDGDPLFEITWVEFARSLEKISGSKESL